MKVVIIMIVIIIIMTIITIIIIPKMNDFRTVLKKYK